MTRNSIGRAFGAGMDDRMVVAAATTMLLLVGGVLSMLLLTLAALKAALWLSRIRQRSQSADKLLSW